VYQYDQSTSFYGMYADTLVAMTVCMAKALAGKLFICFSVLISVTNASMAWVLLASKAGG
jgi:hypothetical protein